MSEFPWPEPKVDEAEWPEALQDDILRVFRILREAYSSMPGLLNCSVRGRLANSSVSLVFGGLQRDHVHDEEELAHAKLHAERLAGPIVTRWGEQLSHFEIAFFTQQVTSVDWQPGGRVDLPTQPPAYQ